MESHETNAFEIEFQHPGVDSGSAYEISSEDGSIPSEDETQVPQSSWSTSQKKRSRTRSGSARDVSRTRRISPSDDTRLRSSSTSSQSNQRLREAASVWAANFQEPSSPTNIRSPTRHPVRTQSKRKADKPPSEVRYKRLKRYYNNEYRELLNADIHDAVARITPEDQTPLERSQIGSSIWTSKEKDMFFSALERLGRDNVREIACQIGSKSEFEVQQYILLLQQGLMNAKFDETRHKLLDFKNLPAAVQISEECCSLLSRAGDALACRQERAEEQAEEVRWGDSWLLTAEVSSRLDRRREQEGGKEEIEKFLPAANLFNLKNWLELSSRIFMNPAFPRDEDNWELLAEPGETPAIRATAFEDFHSLAINITKRLVATTLFNTMSRLRATRAKRVKHAEVNQDDVKSAARILGLRLNNKIFWMGCARRCNLEVFDDEVYLDDGFSMTHDQVEMALGRETADHSQSRSMGRHEHFDSNSVQSEVESEDLVYPTLNSEDLELEEASPHGDESELTSSLGFSDHELTDCLDSEAPAPQSHVQRLMKRRKARKENELAQETYTESFDLVASQLEEQQLWTLLRQTAPFDIKPEPVELVIPPKGIKNGMAESGNWRDNMEYWSEWETLHGPVPPEHFEGNKKRRSFGAKSAANRTGSEQDLIATTNSTEGEDGTLSINSDDDSDQVLPNVQKHMEQDDEGDLHGESLEHHETSENRTFDLIDPGPAENPPPIPQSPIFNNEITTHFQGQSEDFTVLDEVTAKHEYHD